jgi:hypothetical protein
MQSLSLTVSGSFLVPFSFSSNGNNSVGDFCHRFTVMGSLVYLEALIFVKCINYVLFCWLVASCYLFVVFTSECR